jgi:hypothetical protein
VEKVKVFSLALYFVLWDYTNVHMG